MKEENKERAFILLDENEQKVITETIKLYGKDRQMLKFSEEAAELSAAVSRYLNKTSNENLEALLNEIADIQIMIYQFIEMKNACAYPINDFIENKIKRLDERNQKEKEHREYLFEKFRFA